MSSKADTAIIMAFLALPNVIGIYHHTHTKDQLWTASIDEGRGGWGRAATAADAVRQAMASRKPEEANP